MKQKQAKPGLFTKFTTNNNDLKKRRKEGLAATPDRHFNFQTEYCSFLLLINIKKVHSQIKKHQKLYFPMRSGL
jgi:hypothetical protein